VVDALDGGADAMTVVLPLLAGLSVIPPALAWRRWAADRRLRSRPLVIGTLLVVLALARTDGLLLAVMVVCAWLVRVRLRRVRAERARSDQLTASVPDAVDLAVVAATAGLTVALIVQELARAAPDPIRAELSAAMREVDAGRRLADALIDVPDRVGEAVRPLVTALVASERDGVPLLASLERVAAQVRDERRRAGERAARRLSVTLLFPLVLCILPAFVLLGLVPLLASSLRDLQLP
jgi:tight adherence protein C